MLPVQLYVFILSVTVVASGSSQSKDVQSEIDADVWRPFIESFNSRDDHGFRKVHSDDMTRVIRDDKRVMRADEYLRPQPDSIRVRWATWKRNIELRFTERIASDDRAFEVGYYKTTSMNSETGEKRVSYGKFHVLLRKEQGTWKILMDADGQEGVDEEIFRTGEPID